MKNRDLIFEMGYVDAIVFESPDYDDAVIGVSDDGRVIYDYNKMVECLVNQDGMTELEAIEFIDYNTIRAIPYAGEYAPIIMYRIGDY